jgi:ATP-binding cassette subfamily F protein uup
LDEPTNHLDLPTIEWLEDELRNFPGGLLLVSHDRTFLDNLTNRTFWIERGKVFRRNQGFNGFTDWADKILADEENQQHKLNKKIAEETRWLREGLTARRKRNEGRLGRLLELRQVKADRLRRPGLVNMDVGKADSGGSLVLEANDISLRFTDPNGGEKIIVQNFSLKVKRGDRIGLIGRNGAGKTSLLKMLIGRDKPDRGRVRIGFGVESIYFDQKRESLNPDDTLWSTLCPGGGDTVFVRDKPRHVASYLRDFLFRDRQITAKVKTLSGGERNRLLMAKLFAANHNLLVLDEPTNDLDIETLDLLQDELARYDGTILLVSHDRDFIDRVVTSIIAVEGDGNIEEYAGGFNDYLRQRPAIVQADSKSRKSKPETAKPSKAAPKLAKLSFNEQRDLDLLPSQITKYEQDIGKLQTLLADPGFFSRDPVNFERATKRLAETELAHSSAEERWLELEMRRENLTPADDA